MLDIARDYNENNFDNNQFEIVLCELHNPLIHGIDNNSDPNIACHYLVHSRYKYNSPYDISEEYDSDNTSNYNYDSSDNEEEDPNIFEIIPEFKRHIRRNVLPYNGLTRHPFIRNYKTIISNENYIKPEIAKCVYLSGEECVAILKTFWLRLVQRTWKRVFAERKQVIRQRMRPDSLRHRETMGKWPSSCNRLPGLHGMLYEKPKIL
jgi:hypothetical protein